MSDPGVLKTVEEATQYSDVFAVSNLDLGEFTAIEHHIETGEARSVKQRMRRTPTVIQRGGRGSLRPYADRGGYTTVYVRLGRRRPPC